jgi:ubiquinone/menaquinone biosynthesis C-methylase UbiE
MTVSALHVPLVCPRCRCVLAAGVADLSCPQCRGSYVVDESIPLATVGTPAAAAQAAWFDEHVDREWEIARPHAAPALYRWLLEEKLRRAVAGLELRDASVLTVCSGSGMDAEFLARAGARVVATDVSLGAAQRIAERARRFGVPIAPVVADAACLPFADASFDVVFVHDGLHHLENPLAGIAEMARVARHAVSISEPARAAVTAAAIRLGLAEEREEAGNAVARLDLGAVERALAERGYRTIRAERYAMLYRHEPRWGMRLFSLPGLFTVARAAVRTANAVAGSLGNKLVVVGVRE